jgi:hypothetical protein
LADLHLTFLSTDPAGLDFAVLALKDVPKGPGMAVVAMPEKKRGV